MNMRPDTTFHASAPHPGGKTFAGGPQMLVPIYLGLCATDEDAGHRAAGALMAGNAVIALAVAAAHTAAMIAAGGAMAILVHGWLGLKFLSKSWFNLDAVWALSLAATGAAGLWSAW